MRALVALLAVLAGFKIWANEHLRNAALEEAVVAAYRQRAIDACHRDVQIASTGTPQKLWASPASIRLVIGRSDVVVYPWEVEHEAWDARYKNPYLRVTAGGQPYSIVCEYDIKRGAASLART